MHYEIFLTKQDINTPVCRESEPKLTIAQIGNQISRPNRLNLNEEIGYPNHNFTKYTKITLFSSISKLNQEGIDAMIQLNLLSNS